MHTNTQSITHKHSRSLKAALIALLALTVGATAQNSATTHAAQNASSDAKAHKAKWYQIGKASWYGRGFQGHKTASGEAFDLNMLTCAHRTLPIGTLLRVTNLTNRRSIMVRVNDRGPFPEGRIVDLSFAAAKSLGFGGHGMAHVRLDKVEGAEAAQLNWPELNRPAYGAFSR